MPNSHGDFIWYELLTTDAVAAERFYAGLIGWKFRSGGPPEMDYRTFGPGERSEVGGLMTLTKEMEADGTRPMWTGYIAVDDVDAAVIDIVAAGGTVRMEPQDIPNVGRFAFVADPQGAPFYIMRGFSEEESHAFALREPRDGHCAWNELATADCEGAARFYEAVFGWECGDSMDMGEMGPYDMYRNPPHAEMFGAIERKTADVPSSLWAYYFRIADIDIAADYVRSNGGRILNGPMEIPGGEFILQALDPQGAMVSLLGKRG